MTKLTHDEVLDYQKGRRHQSTVKSHYIKWRSEQEPPIPLRCDVPECTFYSSPLIWNGKELKLILDHINGVSGDNRLENLRLLCPNCNSQQKTQGGGNKGRVEQSEGGFATVSEDGKRNYTLVAKTGHYKITGREANLVLKSKDVKSQNSNN